ncbi:hypothetical protein D3C77_465920 [compost metagenome]
MNIPPKRILSKLAEPAHRMSQLGQSDRNVGFRASHLLVELMHVLQRQALIRTEQHHGLSKSYDFHHILLLIRNKLRF